jgi:hypothetical protein
MKNSENKKNSLKKTISYLFFLTILIFSSCNKDDTKPNCGCDSDTLDTVPSENFPEVPIEEQKSGILFYKTSEKVDGFYDDDQYNNRFWIFQGTEGCYNCKRNFIICNENLLGTEYDYLKNNNDSIEIKFTGDLKSLCVLRPILADYNYAEIVLTLIEQQ